jgi:hypothetical protein
MAAAQKNLAFATAIKLFSPSANLLLIFLLYGLTEKIHRYLPPKRYQDPATGGGRTLH